jgi:hypothetical protein
MRIRHSAIAFAALMLVATQAVAVRITPAHSGSWFDPAYDKQGFAIEVLDKVGTGPERRVLVYWYTWDNEGTPVWAIGVSETQGNLIELTMQRAFGGARPPAQVEASELIDWAEMTITFDTCHRANAAFTMVDTGQSGEYDLQRLTHIGPTTCTGGMSDEVPPGADPITLVEQLAATAAYPMAQGTVKYKLRPAYAELEIDVRKLPAGAFEVRVGGEARGTIDVTINGGGNGIGIGSIIFASPAGTGPLLDFEPRGELIEIVDASGAVALSATLPGP